MREILKLRSKSEYIMKKLGDLIPMCLYAEIERIGCSRADFPSGLSEVRLRRFGRSSIVVSGENISLLSRVTERDIDIMLNRLTGGSLYAHENQIRNGFISLDHGIRVGVYGDSDEDGYPTARISGLVIRLPLGECDCIDGIFSEWKSFCRHGMLIYSLPGGGKTTALRALAGRISAEFSLRVAVVDERREFVKEDYRDGGVDVLSGCSKARGIEIALRTLSPEVIIVDEIGSEEECRALLGVGRGGVPIIATAHAGSAAELCAKKSVAPLINEGYFDRIVGLYRKGKAFRYTSVCP